mmetsp:Transcript_132127/g.410583  ORF Transcript_132127/g.410583 Transcript_132127/m.410583 type:complete len:262 (+) Transcript_132127:191-976(+)
MHACTHRLSPRGLLVEVVREATHAELLVAGVARGPADHLAACLAPLLAAQLAAGTRGVRRPEGVDGGAGSACHHGVLRVLAFEDHGVDRLLPHLVQVLLERRQLPDDLLPEVAQLVVAVRLHGGAVSLQPPELPPMPLLHVPDAVLPVALLIRVLLHQLPVLLADGARVVEGVQEPLFHLPLLLALPAQGILACPELLEERLPAHLRELLDVLPGLLCLLQKRLDVPHLLRLLGRHLVAHGPLLRRLHDGERLFQVRNSVS